MALFISQSGETADTLAALRYAREAGAPSAAVVNVRESTMAREADAVLPTYARASRSGWRPPRPSRRSS